MRIYAIFPDIPEIPEDCVEIPTNPVDLLKKSTSIPDLEETTDDE